MATVQERVAELREEIESRLEITGEQMKGLASQAAMRIAHLTGDWQAGQPVPSKDKQDWIIVAAFDHSPYDVGEQGEDWTFGESRVYVLCPADVFGPLRDMIVAPGADMVCMVYRLLGNGGLIARPKSEEAFASCLVDEFEALAEMAGIQTGGGEPDEWKCPACQRNNPDELPQDEDADEDDEPDKSKHCAYCGAVRTEVVTS